MRKIISLFVTFIFLLPAPAYSKAAPEKRVILALFDSSEEFNRREDDNLIHNNAEMVLNYLGMKVRYHDISKGFPEDGSLEDVYGIMTWFMDETIPNAKEYCLWASNQVKGGRKYILLRNFGAYKDTRTNAITPLSIMNELFNSMDLELGGEWADNPFVTEIVEKKSHMVEFERTLDEEVGIYEKVTSLDRNNKIYLKINKTDLADGGSVAVVTTPKGGFAAEDCDIFIDYISRQVRWRINPFLFFEEALQLKDMPRYDTTTLFGRRIFYSHIDGDGVRNISEIDKKRICGEVILEEILTKYDLPITVSFVTAEVDPKYLGSQKLVDLAREILKLDNVEIGVHAFSHPLDWERQITYFPIKGYSRKTMRVSDLDVLSESPYERAALITVNRQEYLKREIEGAADYINNHLAPEGKRVAVNQWSGDCSPPAEAIDMANRIGLKNINGGDARFDRSIPSYTGVTPLTRQIKGRAQVYTSNANENIYTNGWLGPFYGFAHAIETFQQTEMPTLVRAPPRRVTPINVYYHFYSGEKEVSLKALKEVYDYVLTQKIIPIFTSHYAGVVEGFLSGKVRHLSDGGWEFSDYGRCRTVRIDDTTQYPDLARSQGIIGFTRWHDSMYIHLANTSHAVLYLTEKSPSGPYLREASTVLHDCNISNTKASFTTRGFREGVYHLANMSPRARYAVRVYSPDTKKPVYRKRFTSDRKGNLHVKIPAKDSYRVVIEKEG